ncbi:FMN-binding protein [Kitasatospora sp. MAP5-34]|uniref:FMN-binding protein n=1 Tax=Kitasatospora sp. MAP5-34 TaxID=3035102 RepID=UPI0024766EE5|nr:FMN-binding protein [Kitasatospora sp. MAP5-34]MDH6578281.1 uncharacterized protein with FMN-binding domain [Kitasatospora sp. MAP5-34]
MRRAIVTGTATVAGVILLLSLKPHNSGAGAVSSKVISSGGSSSSSVSASGGSPGSSPSGSAASSGASGASAPAGASRTVTGSAIDTRYGPVQVRVVLDGKKISRIDVIQYPDQSGRDQEINSYALPQLNQEAIAAQSAQIDVVSGASYTSDGYTRSLQSALDQAS